MDVCLDVMITSFITQPSTPRPSNSQKRKKNIIKAYHVTELLAVNRSVGKT